MIETNRRTRPDELSLHLREGDGEVTRRHVKMLYGRL